jgi:hypothetical protein
VKEKAVLLQKIWALVLTKAESGPGKKRQGILYMKAKGTSLQRESRSQLVA